jgi:hypothetical protein
LSKAQLARKRANDREAQRNIRQRTKEHIANLEKKVRELEQSGRASSIERVIKRNRALEQEIEKLRAQVAAHQAAAAPAQIPPEIPEELLIPQKVTLDWMPSEPPSCPWPGDVASHMPDMDVNSSIVGSAAGYTSTVAPYPSTSSSVGYDDEASQQMYTPKCNSHMGRQGLRASSFSESNEIRSCLGSLPSGLLPTLPIRRPPASWFRGGDQPPAYIQHHMLAVSAFNLRMADLEQAQSPYYTS